MQGSPPCSREKKKNRESLGAEERQVQRHWGRIRFGMGGAGAKRLKLLDGNH